MVKYFKAFFWQIKCDRNIFYWKRFEVGSHNNNWVLCASVCACCRVEQLYQKVMSLWHQQHVNMKSVVSWHYLLKDIGNISGWNLDKVWPWVDVFRQLIIILFNQWFVLLILFSPCQHSGALSGSCRTPGVLESLGVTFGRLPV